MAEENKRKEKEKKTNPRLENGILTDNLVIRLAMEKGGEGDIIPKNVVDAMERSLVNVEELRVHLLKFLALCEPDVLAEMAPLQRTQALLMLARATSTLYTLWLRSSGVHPDNHPAKTELKRLSLYHDKLERCLDLSKAPLRPSTTLNYQAATRFIEHSLPCLTPVQRKRMRDISTGEGAKSKFSRGRISRKKSKWQSSEKQSIRAAAQEFLEKAAKELLGDNKGDMKGPLRMESLDKEDLSMS